MTKAIPFYEPLERRLFLSTYAVTTTADGGAGSLRQAILNANAHAGADTITFAIGSGVKTIAPATVLPDLTDGVTIDGTSQPGYAGKPIVEISGATTGGGAYAYGLHVLAANCTIKGLVINGFNGPGILVGSGNNTTIQNNYIGLDTTGTIAKANNSNGIELDTSNNLVGGNLASQRNVISGNAGIGVFLFSGGTGNSIKGNYIGLNAAGNAAVANRVTGIDLQGGNGNTIGGLNAGDGNVVSGNAEDGILLQGSSSQSNTIQQNIVGLDATGSIAIGNGTWGLEVQSGYNQIGGTVAAARNVFSANGQTGIALYLSTSQHNTVQGNYVGTDVTGTLARPNVYAGIAITADAGATVGPQFNLIGGTTPSARNVISGNGHEGVGLFNAADYNTVSGNYIGTKPDGMTALPNQGGGVTMFGGSTGNVIGGTAPGAGNLISGNATNGVFIGADANTIQGNLIGLNALGTAALPNNGDGIWTTNSNSLIGGPTAAARNVIAGNALRGIFLIGPGGNNTIQNNFVGTDRTGAAAVPNGSYGIWEVSNSSGNSILSNTVAFQSVGIELGGGTGNRVAGNSLFSNTQIGLELDYAGEIANDPGDPDAGANNRQNYPVLTSAAGGTISGTLNSAANTTFTLEFFWSAATGPGNFGQKSLGTTNVTTNASGNAGFAFSPATYIPNGYITATATDPSGNTSELGAALGFTRTGGTPLSLTGNNVYLKQDTDGVNVDVWINSATPGAGAPTQKTPFRTISALTFNGSAGNDTLTLDYSAGNFFGAITVNGSTGGTNTVAVVGTPDGDTLTAAAGGATFTSASTGFTPVTLTWANVNALQLLGGTGGNDALNLTAGSYQLNADTATGSPNVSVGIGAGATGAAAADQHLAGLSVASGGLLDIGNHFVYLPSTPANFAAYQQYWVNGYNLNGPNSQAPGLLGDWSGRGGISNATSRQDYSGAGGNLKRTIGVYDGAFFAAQGVGAGPGADENTNASPNLAANQILVRPTLTGDLNGDGKVDDYDVLIFNTFSNYGGAPGSQTMGTQGGDFNGDGRVDDTDVLIFNTAGNYGKGAYV